MRQRISLSAALAVGLLALAGCGGSEPDVDDADISADATEDAPEEFGVAVDNIADEKAQGADEGLPVLEPIGSEPDVDIGPTLGGCSFEHEGQVIFIAGAPDNANARGSGVIQVNGRDRLLASTEMGGPEMIDAGPTMTDGEFTVEVERASGEGQSYGVESVRWPAALVARVNAENEIRYEPGTWTCGV